MVVVFGRGGAELGGGALQGMGLGGHGSLAGADPEGDNGKGEIKRKKTSLEEEKQWR